MAAPLTFLLKNEYEPVEIDGIDIAIAATEEPRTATIERIWLDTTNVRPGRPVPLKILMRSYRGEAVARDGHGRRARQRVWPAHHHGGRRVAPRAVGAA